MNKIKVVLLVLLACFSSAVFSSDKTLDTLVMLRRKQRQISIADFWNAESVIQKIKKHYNVPDTQGALEVLYKIVYSLGVIAWQLLFLIFWWVLILFVSFRAKRNFLSYCVIVVSIFLCISSIGALALDQMYKNGIVKRETDLFLGPDNRYPVKEQLAYLQEVRIIKKYLAWYYVATGVSRGWVLDDKVEII